MENAASNTTFITRIGWHRTYLLVSYEGDAPYLKGEGGALHPFSPVPEDVPGGYDMQVNVANTPPRSLLPEGEWSFADAQGRPAQVAPDVLVDVEGLARSFFFSRGEQLYSARFRVVADGAMPLQLRMRLAFYRRDPEPRRGVGRDRFAKRFLNAYYRLACKLHPKKGDRILLMTENGGQLSGNLAAIDARLRERGLDADFKVSRSARNVFDGKPKVGEWLRTLSLIARQDYVFVEDYVPVFSAIDLDDRTKLVQVWHAGCGFKLVGFARFGMEPSPNPFGSCHRKYRWAIVGNERLREVYAEVFGIEPAALLATGMPRLDHFLDEGRLERCRRDFASRFPQFAGKRIVLFAPTFRGADQAGAHYDYARIDFDALADWCRAKGSAVVFKMHRFVAEGVPVPVGCEDVFAVSRDDDLNDLMPAADVLVTDYSSCFYDFLLLGCPVVFYVYDEPEYRATRGTHRPLADSAPGKVCRTFDDLLAVLGSVLDGAGGQLQPDGKWIDRAAERSGLASDRVIDFVLFGKDDGGVCLG